MTQRDILHRLGSDKDESAEGASASSFEQLLQAAQGNGAENWVESTTAEANRGGEADSGAKPGAIANAKAGVGPAVDQQLVSRICKFIAGNYVRRDNRYYRVDRLFSPIPLEEMKKILPAQIRLAFQGIDLTSELFKEVINRAITSNHSDPATTVRIWNGDEVCRPDHPARLIEAEGAVAINSWHRPSYRDLGVTDADLGPLQELLNWMMPRPEDQAMFLSWLSWSHQYEDQKPTWAILLYSRRRGTGKSTLCQLVTSLFGHENSMTQNSVAKLTSKFNRPLLLKKLVICEDLKLKPESEQGNTLKTYLTEEVTTTEAKGKEVEAIQQKCCFLMTTNYWPGWIDPDERRYFVIDVDHDGHASGPRTGDFQQVIARITAAREDPHVLARLYNALMQYRLANSFNAKSLDVGALESPTMKRIASQGREATLELIEEALAEVQAYAVSLDRLFRLVRERQNINLNRLPHLMQELGWRTEKHKWGGADYARTVYLADGYSMERSFVVGPNGYRAPFEPQNGPGGFEVVR